MPRDLYRSAAGNGDPGPESFSRSLSRDSVVSEEPPNAFFRVDKTNHLRRATWAPASSYFDEVSNPRSPRLSRNKAIGSKARGATTFLELKPKREMRRTVAAKPLLMFSQLPSMMRRFELLKFLTLYWIGRFSVK